MRMSKASLLASCAAFVCSLLLAAAPAEAQVAWNALPPMATPRNAFTLTALADGRALAVGGWNGTALQSCEVYDPVSGAWSPTGQLNGPRTGHSAVRLNDGRVLVAGGTNGSLGLATAEIFDPATGQWTATQNRARAGFSAVMALLTDGRVFLLGDASTSTRAEIFDPSTGLWSDTSTMGTVYRSSPTATRLPDGRVLVAGGYNGSGSPTSGTVYDPVANTWTPTAAHVTPRWLHTATLLPNGRVVILGGRQIATPTVSVATAEVYDPATNAWTPTGAMGTSRIYHTATLLPTGQVVVAGGNQYNGSSYSSALSTSESYDTSAGSFSPLPALGQARYGHREALLPGGKPMVVGGYAAGFLSSAEVFAEALVDSGPPTVALTSPANGATLSGTVTIAADAADDTGVVSVTFYAGSSVLGVDSTPPYQYAWDTTLTYGGPRVLKATARDRANKTADSTINVTVLDSTPPTITLTTPQPGATAPDPVLLEADASDVSGVARVDFLIDGAVVASDDVWPYQASVSASRFTPGSHSATALAEDYQGNSGSSAPVTFSVPVAAGGTATFDAQLGAPACGGGSECDSGQLLVGRGLLGPEPNAPNTLFASSCADGTNGTFHVDESLDRLRIRTLDGSPLEPGKAVEVVATVWAYSSANFLDVYYAPDASSPVWSLVQTIGAPTPGEHTLAVPFVLTSGGARQAIRGVFRWSGVAAPCTGGGYSDHDDLAFSFDGGGSGIQGYDPYFKAPSCLGFGAACDSGALLVGRGSLGPEPNQPNTSFGECPDGNWGQFHVDPSGDRIRVVSADSGPPPA